MGCVLKKPVAISFYFLVYLILGLFIAFMIGLNLNSSLSMVAGKGVFLSKSLIFYIFFDSMPFVLLFSALVLCLYKVRHGAEPVSSAITYSVLCVLVWFLFFPLAFEGRSFALKEKLIEDDHNIEISGGYFRESDNKLYYFIDDSVGQKANVLVLNDTKSNVDFGNLICMDVSSSSSFLAESNPYKDPLIKKSMDNRSTFLFGFFYMIKERAAAAWKRNIVSWLFFCAFGFAACTAYGFVHASSWRLVNVMMIVIYEGFVFWFNNLYFTGIFSSMRKFLNELLLGENFSRGAFFVENSIDFPLFLMNIIFGIVAIVFGILFSKRNKNF